MKLHPAGIRRLLSAVALVNMGVPPSVATDLACAPWNKYAERKPAPKKRRKAA